jgi:LmeA-like phospholipid-binding
MTDQRIEETWVADDIEYAERPSRRPTRVVARRAGMPLLGVIVLVLVAVLVVGDRVAAKVASEQIEARVVAELQERGVTAGSTDVSVGGFPFLAQVAEGRYEEITVDMANVRLEGVTLPELHVVANDVRADTGDLMDGTAEVVAARVTGTGTVDYPTLATIVDYGRFGLTGVSFGDGGNGGLRVQGTARLVGGLEAPLTATADLTAVEGAIRVRIRDLEFDSGSLPAPLGNAVRDLTRKLSVNVKLPELPFQLSLDDVRAESDGLLITGTAADVALAS